MSQPAWLAQLMARERLPASYADELERWQRPLAERIVGWAKARRSLVVGVCAPQASGKTTLCAVLEQLLGEAGLRAVTLSLDDLYLGREARTRLAGEVHPLLGVRGVPGTHDVALGIRMIDALRRSDDVVLPRFDKAADDRAPAGTGRSVVGPMDVILFEGWCVGARPQAATALAEPVNRLEAEEDARGVWRRWVNAQLAGPYAGLFGRIDRLVMLAPPGFEVVAGWRKAQERKLRERLAQEGLPPSRAMSDTQVERFVAHYERLTRWVLEEMPGRADAVVSLDLTRSGTL